MKNYIIGAVAFATGALCGSIASYFLTKKFCKGKNEPQKVIFVNPETVELHADEVEDADVKPFDEYDDPKEAVNAIFPSTFEFDEVKKEVNRYDGSDGPLPPPYMISETEYSEEKPWYSKTDLIYYASSDILAEDGEPVDCPDDILCTNWRELFGVLEDDPNTLYVRNERNATDFEITKVNLARFGDDVCMEPETIIVG